MGNEGSWWGRMIQDTFRFGFRIPWIPEGKSLFTNIGCMFTAPPHLIIIAG